MPLSYSSAYTLDGFLLLTRVKSNHLASVYKVLRHLGKLTPQIPSPTTATCHCHSTSLLFPQAHAHSRLCNCDSLSPKGPSHVSLSKRTRLHIQPHSATSGDPSSLPHCSPVTMIPFVTLYYLSFPFKTFPSVCFLASWDHAQFIFNLPQRPAQCLTNSQCSILTERGWASWAVGRWLCWH